METQSNSQPVNNKKYIDLNKILEIQNYADSLKKWVENFRVTQRSTPNFIDSERLQVGNNQNEFDFYFEKYLKTIKPVINDFSSLISTLNSDEFGFYCPILTQSQIEQLIQVYKPLKNFEILNKEKCLEGLEVLTSDQINEMTRKGVPIYKMNLEIPPQNDEIRFWGSTMLINSFTIIGTVTKGKGLGKQGLGMPTANIKISPELNESLSEYPNGIYITTIKVKGKPEIYVGASSLGTNPHYQNSTSKRILQTYIIYDFKDQTLYGQELVTQFHQLIRLQFKFNDFSAFLNGMRNDIEIAKNWGISHQFIKQ